MASPTADSPLVDPLLTRRSVRAAAAGLAAVAVLPATAQQAQAAAPRRDPYLTRRHKRLCKHYHRCPAHPRHVCRAKHRCRHLNHRKPKPRPQQPPRPPVDQPEPPVDPPVDPPVEEPPTEEPPTEEPPVEEPQHASPVEADGVATAWARHVASRLGYGLTPSMLAEMVDAGSAEAWVERQLDPASITDTAADATRGWWDALGQDYYGIVGRDNDDTEPAWVAMQNYQRWCLQRRVSSKRQVLEVMTEFWENHLHVPVHDDAVHPYRIEYGSVLRTHALGRFDQMLQAAITHPAMGVSLDNNKSHKRAPNENLGRELLELHTVGRGNHTEDDVKNAAKILTGYWVDTWRTWQPTYDTNAHWTGAVRVLDFTHANSAADGRPVVAAFLRYLAHHPLTARRLARKLAVRFVSDSPSEALVEHLADAYLAAETDIKAVLRALLAHPEFADSAGAKVRTPTDDVVATYRALDVRFAKPSTDNAAANALLWQAGNVGQTPFSWPRPDGPPDRNAAWSSGSRVLASFDVHYSAANGWWPTTDITYKTPASWLPSSSVRFDALVDHLSVKLLGQHAPARLLEAACSALGVRATDTITASHSIVRWRMGLLLSTLLDTPDHLHR